MAVLDLTKPHTVIQADGSDYEFNGALLGFGTSHRDSHLDHPPGTAPVAGQRCSGCRWTETTIYLLQDAADGKSKYLVYIVGRSILPNEIDKIKLIWANDPDSVLDSLLISPPRKHRSYSGALELPQPNYDALEEAAARDSALADILREWNRRG